MAKAHMTFRTLRRKNPRGRQFCDHAREKHYAIAIMQMFRIEYAAGEHRSHEPSDVEKATQVAATFDVFLGGHRLTFLRKLI
jgi:hypothetical protein